MKAINIKWDIDDDDEKSLPTEIIIPNDMTDEEEISDYLSNVTGFCHQGYDLVETSNYNSNSMTRKQKIELCTITNNGGDDYLDYILQMHCNETQIEIIDRLTSLYNETSIGIGRESYTDEELEEYYNKKWEILSDFGIENRHGRAYFEGKFYK